MTEDLIVVEGNLRLPTLRAPTDPSLQFGREWSPVSTRPGHSDSENALFAARFETAYIPARDLPDTNGSYRGSSVWAMFVKPEIPRAMLRLNEGAKAANDGGADRADPIHLQVGKPTNAGASKRYFGKPAAVAIALACFALVMWLLIGPEPGALGHAPAALAANVGMSAQPSEAKPQPDLLANAEIPTVVAESPPLPASADADASAATTREASGAHMIVDTAARKRNGRVKAVLTSRAQPVVSSASGAGKRVAKRDATRRVRVISARTHGGRASTTTASMKPAALYAMLQHSPTLDSNTRYASGSSGGQP